MLDNQPGVRLVDSMGKLQLSPSVRHHQLDPMFNVPHIRHEVPARSQHTTLIQFTNIFLTLYTVKVRCRNILSLAFVLELKSVVQETNLLQVRTEASTSNIRQNGLE
uniref:Uncharacterized protein n=1 Tax=Cacopsylla melanoneura TaxID=428564 RepID=A0A8D9AGK4_9HEMI